MIAVANESYGHGHSEKCSPEVVLSYSETGVLFMLVVPRSLGN